MAKQATRLSDFQIPRTEGILSQDKVSKADPDALEVAVPAEPLLQPVLPPQKLAETLAWEHTPEHAVVPNRIAPRPAAEPRQAMTVRLPVSMHERIRMLMFMSRRSQQDIVEEALDAFLIANRT